MVFTAVNTTDRAGISIVGGQIITEMSHLNVYLVRFNNCLQIFKTNEPFLYCFLFRNPFSFLGGELCQTRIAVMGQSALFALTSGLMFSLCLSSAGKRSPLFDPTLLVLNGFI